MNTYITTFKPTMSSGICLSTPEIVVLFLCNTIREKTANTVNRLSTTGPQTRGVAEETSAFPESDSVFDQSEVSFPVDVRFQPVVLLQL